MEVGKLRRRDEKIMKSEDRLKNLIQKAEECVPKEYKYSSSGIFFVEENEKKYITNFIPIVVSKVVMIDIHSKEKNEYVEQWFQVRKMILVTWN